MLTIIDELRETFRECMSQGEALDALWRAQCLVWGAEEQCDTLTKVAAELAELARLEWPCGAFVPVAERIRGILKGGGE